MHRAIMSPPDDMWVDHEKHRAPDERIIDNRRTNLRVCTPRQNQMNKLPKIGGTSQYKGVSWHRRDKKWHARIRINGKRKHLGRFADELAAARAYDAAATKHFGEFALTNG
jgi:hypothetical protein